MKRQFLIAGISLLIIVGLALLHLGCGLFETYTIKVTNETGVAASFGIDEEVQDIGANQYLEISNVSSGEHAWAAAWRNSLGIVVSDSGIIDVQDDITIRITLSGVRM